MGRVHEGVHGVVHGVGVYVLFTSCMHDDDYSCYSLQGFKYFALYLRGREELICRVLNEPMVSALINRLIHKNEIKAVIKGSKCSEPTK